MAGLGNWAAVAEHVGTKSQDACRQHYYGIYIDSPAFPEPMPAASMASVDKLQVHCAPPRLLIIWMRHGRSKMFSDLHIECARNPFFVFTLFSADGSFMKC